MFAGGLSTDQAPPIHVPFRFFFTAPIFGIILSLLLLTDHGALALSSHKNLSAFGLMHLFTLGFMANVMIGALFQMMPVIGGAPVPRANYNAWWIHVSVVAGALLLPAGFLFMKTEWIGIGASIVLAGITGASLLFLVTLVLKAQKKPTMKTMSLSLVSLILGSLTAVGLVYNYTVSGVSIHSELVLIHIGFMVIGWTYLLIVGVTFQVVPMFFVTPEYHDLIKRYLAPGIFITLILRAITIIALDTGAIKEWILHLLDGIILLGAMIHGVATLIVLNKRMRKIFDLTILYFRVAMISIIVSGLVYYSASLTGNTDISLPMKRFSTVVFLLGGVGSTMYAMLNKIIPFLIWFHLTASGKMAPGMREILNYRISLGQAITGMAGLVLIAGASIGLPGNLSFFSGILFILSFFALLINIVIGINKYRHVLNS